MEQIGTIPLFLEQSKPRSRRTLHSHHAITQQTTQNSTNTNSHQHEHKLDKVRNIAYNSSYEWEIFYSTQATATTRTFPSSDGFVHNEEMLWQPVLDVVSSFLTKGKTWGSIVAYHVTQPMLKQGVRKSRNNQFR
jgi:hypothetical protein